MPSQVGGRELTQVVGFCGFAQSGKDTAAGFLVERGWTRLAFADILRESLYNLNPIVQTKFRSHPGPDGPIDTPYEWERVQAIVDSIGWDRAKVEYPEIRQLLQRFGTEVGRELYGENFWVDRVMNQVTHPGRYVITDVRFPNEEIAVHKAGGRLFRINRGGVVAVNGHASEDIDRLQIDGVIPNTSDVDKFRAVVLEAVGLK